ncbi:MAG: aspartyl protease family protein [Pyrinomonadaceae bacterium]
MKDKIMHLLRKITVAFAIFIVLTGSALGQPKQSLTDTAFVDVPVQFDGKYLLTPVSIDNHNLMFVLDTAAGGSVISPATRDAIGFGDKDGEISEVVGAGGTVKYQSLRVPSIGIGGHKQENFNVTVIDLKKFQKKDGQPYAGLLGNDFLRAFDVEINLPASRLRLYPHDANGRVTVSRLNKRASVPNLAASEGFIVLNVFVEGKSVEAILDSGAPASVMNWQAAKQAGITRETKGVKRREQGISGIGTQVADTYLYCFKKIKVGDMRFTPEDTRIADLSIFKALGLSEKPAMLFGLDMLKNRILFVSYSTKKLYFYKPSSSL